MTRVGSAAVSAVLFAAQVCWGLRPALPVEDARPPMPAPTAERLGTGWADEDQLKTASANWSPAWQPAAASLFFVVLFFSAYFCVCCLLPGNKMFYSILFYTFCSWLNVKHARGGGVETIFAFIFKFHGTGTNITVTPDDTLHTRRSHLCICVNVRIQCQILVSGPQWEIKFGTVATATNQIQQYCHNTEWPSMSNISANSKPYWTCFRHQIDWNNLIIPFYNKHTLGAPDNVHTKLLIRI